MEVTSKLPNVETTIFSVMSALAAKHNAINLSQGFPDFEINQSLKNYVEKGLAANQVQYAPMQGRMDLRQTIAAKIEKQHQTSINPQTEITITAGATQAIYATISAFVHEKDEVILFDPAYDCYAPAIRLNKGVPVHINLVHPSYSINWEEVKQKVSPKTRLIVVNNPQNPTGSVFKQKDIDELIALTRAYPNLLILSDEVYEQIQFSGKHLSLLAQEKLRKRSIITYSFGKTLHVTGWKVGYCIAPASLTHEIQKVHQYMVFCVNNTMQYAINSFLNKGEFVHQTSQLFKQKRDLFLAELSASRFKVLPCDGTYFCLLDYSAISDLPDVDFAIQLTQKYGVATIPVSVFYNDKTDHKVIRVCFAKKNETLIAAAKKLCKI